MNEKWLFVYYVVFLPKWGGSINILEWEIQIGDKEGWNDVS